MNVVKINSWDSTQSLPQPVCALQFPSRHAWYAGERVALTDVVEQCQLLLGDAGERWCEYNGVGIGEDVHWGSYYIFFYQEQDLMRVLMAQTEAWEP